MIGKDLVTRMSLSQMETFRADLLNCTKTCHDGKVSVCRMSLGGEGPSEEESLSRALRVRVEG